MRALSTSTGLALIFIVVAVLPLGTLAAYSGYALEEAAHDRMVLEREKVALDGAIRIAALMDQGLAPREALRDSGLPEGRRTYLLSPDGTSLTSEGPLPRDAALAAAIGARASGSFERNETRIAFARVPGHDLVLVTETPEREISLFGGLPLIEAGVLFLSVGLSLLAVGLSRRYVAAPLTTVARASERIAEGHWDQRAPPAGTVETRALAVTFNRMADDLAEHHAALASTNARLDELVEARTRQLTRAVEDLRAFNFTVHHELREPLRSLETLVAHVLADPPEGLGDEARETLETVHRRAVRLQAIIFDLLYYEELGREKPTYEPVDLTEAFDEAAAVLAAAASRRNARFERPPELPQVRGHSAGLTQVFEELLENGILYNESEEPRVVVTVREEDDEGVTLAFTDNGIGIPADRRDDVFQLFQRLHPVGRFTSGTGIGLAAARRIVDLHEGSLKVEEAPTGGTTFLLRLPWQGPRDMPDLPKARLEREF